MLNPNCNISGIKACRDFWRINTQMNCPQSRLVRTRSKFHGMGPEVFLFGPPHPPRSPGLSPKRRARLRFAARRGKHTDFRGRSVSDPVKFSPPGQERNAPLTSRPWAYVRAQIHWERHHQSIRDPPARCQPARRWSTEMAIVAFMIACTGGSRADKLAAMSKKTVVISQFPRGRPGQKTRAGGTGYFCP